MRCLVAVVVAAIIAAIIGSCSGFPSRGNLIPNLSAADVAVIRSGAYTRIAGLDGRAVKHLDISVQPGSHILSIAFVKRAMGNKLLYTSETASLTFVARPGHTYLVNAEVIYESVWARFIVTDFSWIAYVTDKQEKQKIAATDPLPLKIEHIFEPWYEAQPM